MMRKGKSILFFVFSLIFALLFLRLLYLQVARYQHFTLLAKENAAKTVRDPAPRGIIFDRSGRSLVENQPVYSVNILPHILSAKSLQLQNKVLKTLGQLLSEEVEYKISATEPIIIRDNISLTTAIKIREKQNELPGVVVTSRPVRFYPYEDLAAHLLGYVGEIEAEELKHYNNRGYTIHSLIGKDGVEKIYDQLLRGIDGGKKIEVDVYGRPLRLLESLDPIAGADLYLTIDLDLQKATEQALGKYIGAVVVLDTISGEVLAMASHPSYNGNDFSKKEKKQKLQSLNQKRFPFVNRSLAIYPPGSVFKVITLAAALEQGVADANEIINCPGYYKINQRIARCWLEEGHGRISVQEGLVWSCDVVFYELSRRLGPDLLARYAKHFNLGKRQGIDLPQERKGTIPSTAWKARFLGQKWYPGDSINYGIGQGFVQVTPLQMAVVYAGLARGKLFKPYVAKVIKDKSGQILYQGGKRIIDKIPLANYNLKIIKQALSQVVKRGTGIATRIQGLPAAGKTGTAENPGKPHAWFVCYAPEDQPEIVISVFIEHGEHGDKSSAYVARDILKWYRDNRLGKKYPQENFPRQYILQGKRKVPYRP